MRRCKNLLVGIAAPSAVTQKERKGKDMQLKKIAALCRRRKEIVTRLHVESDGTPHRYIGTAQALYEVKGLEAVSKDMLLIMFDVPEDQRKAWQYREVTSTEYAALDYAYPEEEQAEGFGLLIDCKGETVQPIRVGRELVYVDPVYFEPFSDETKRGEIGLYRRGHLLVAKRGLAVPIAVIVPEGASDKLKEAMEDLADMVVQEHEREAAD